MHGPISAKPSTGQGGKSPLLFEVAWEVCNQLGGIYTVLKTKAPSVLSRWGNRYFLIGPYNAESAAIEFEATTPDGALGQVFENLEAKGITVHFGRWLIKGKPQVILLDFSKRFSRLHEDKYFLWKDQGITTPDNDFELNNCINFGACVAEFFEELSKLPDLPPTVAHFHEWMAATGIGRMRKADLPIITVFTTHATLLGRYIAGGNPHFYDELDRIDPFVSARDFNIEPRFLLERTAAQHCHIFTTISRVTARETEKFLGRAPDFLLPNGINLEKFTALHEFQNLHLKYKERIHEFVMGHFFGSYSFDLDRTIYIVTSGRYEYSNKGMDVFIEALSRLNSRLKEIFDPPTVCAFIITKGNVKSLSVGALQNHSMLDDLKGVCSELESSFAKKMLSVVATGNFPQYEDLLPHDFQVRLKRAMHSRKTTRLPSIVTHDMVDDSGDPVLRHLRHRRLFNEATDPVKVIFHPQFLTATSPLFNLDYDQFVRGCHLGIFPSYYEPWGYTPLECLALGIPTVTTDLTGFGDFAEHMIAPSLEGTLFENGIWVLHRARQNTDNCIEELTSFLYRFVQLSRRERIEIRNRSERLSELFDWSKLIRFYDDAHSEAVRRSPLAVRA